MFPQINQLNLSESIRRMMPLKVITYTKRQFHPQYTLIDTPGIVDSQTIFTQEMEDAVVELSKIAAHILGIIYFPFFCQ